MPVQVHVHLLPSSYGFLLTAVFGIFLCFQPVVQLHVIICNIFPRSLILKLMFRFCRYWVRQNSYQTMLSLNMDMAVSRKQKDVLNMAFRYVFTVAFTHAVRNSKLLLYSSNILFWTFFLKSEFNYYFVILKTSYWRDIHPDRSRFF